MAKQGFVALAIAVSGLISTASAEPVGTVCRKALSGLNPMSQVSTRIASGRIIVSCLGQKGEDKSIIVLEVKGDEAIVLMSPRPYLVGEFEPRLTYVVSEGESIPRPVYTNENPIGINDLRRKAHLFTVDSSYSLDDEVGTSGRVTDIFAIGKDRSRHVASFDGGSWGEGGDSGHQEPIFDIDENGALVDWWSSSGDGVHEKLNIVRYRLVGDSLVATSTRTCVHVFGQDSATETAVVTVVGQICADVDSKKCEKHPGLVVHIVDAVSGKAPGGEDRDMYEVIGPDGRKAYVVETEVRIDCPLPKESRR